MHISYMRAHHKLFLSIRHHRRYSILVGIIFAVAVTTILLYSLSTVHTAELSYEESSPRGALGGNVIPASCDSNPVAQHCRLVCTSYDQISGGCSQTAYQCDNMSACTCSNGTYRPYGGSCPTPPPAPAPAPSPTPAPAPAPAPAPRVQLWFN